MPISGVVIKCRPGCEEQVAAQAKQFPGVEIYAALPDGQVVAVIEADTVNGEADLAMQMQQISGVLSVQVAYHDFEDEIPAGEKGGAYGTDEA